MEVSDDGVMSFAWLRPSVLDESKAKTGRTVALAQLKILARSFLHKSASPDEMHLGVLRELADIVPKLLPVIF